MSISHANTRIVLTTWRRRANMKV